ncbi:amidohydrolase family protein [Streptomyces sp. NBC_01304]|uniref:amidohydrolase family protein n=1 Tax=Streptomyces sp. NBC_01304 TaxID=2903818 RepID=UPI002E11EC77|nr:amidohydrolase [Streptomyces sp. NBC_01304]
MHPQTHPHLIDHHCHGILRTPHPRPTFEAFLTESHAPAAAGTTFFDTQLGFAVRRVCPPLLDLDPHAPPEVYLARRHELGQDETARRLLGAAGITEYLVDTGLPGNLTTPQDLATLSGSPATAREVVRLESLAQKAADEAKDAQSFLATLATTIQAAAHHAAAFKSIAAYRHGLRLDPDPPTEAETHRAAAAWLKERTHGARLHDPTLLRHLLWSAVATGLPLQLHTGFGDPDLRLRDADPLLLTDFIRAAAPTPLILLHGYPYHRGAGYLAHVHPHVYADLGLALTHTGARAEAVLAEFLELTPFGKLLFSTDAYGLPELYVVGAQLYREALDALLTRWVDSGAWSAADAERVAHLIGAGNARRVYSSSGPSGSARSSAGRGADPADSR